MRLSFLSIVSVLSLIATPAVLLPHVAQAQENAQSDARQTRGGPHHNGQHDGSHAAARNQQAVTVQTTTTVAPAQTSAPMSQEKPGMFSHFFATKPAASANASTSVSTPDAQSSGTHNDAHKPAIDNSPPAAVIAIPSSAPAAFVPSDSAANEATAMQGSRKAHEQDLAKRKAASQADYQKYQQKLQKDRQADLQAQQNRNKE